MALIRDNLSTKTEHSSAAESEGDLNRRNPFDNPASSDFSRASRASSSAASVQGGRAGEEVSSTNASRGTPVVNAEDEVENLQHNPFDTPAALDFSGRARGDDGSRTVTHRDTSNEGQSCHP